MLVDVLFIMAIVLAGLVTAPALAHVLEMPGKMRLSEAEYRIVQRIYYPGFTLAGMAEVGAPIVTLALLFLVPGGSLAFYLLFIAFVAYVVIQAVFWLVTQPVNRSWISSMKLGGAGARLFGAAPERRPAAGFDELRARWEYSHVARAALSVLGLIAIALAAAAARAGGAGAAVC